MFWLGKIWEKVFFFFGWFQPGLCNGGDELHGSGLSDLSNGTTVVAGHLESEIAFRKSEICRFASVRMGKWMCYIYIIYSIYKIYLFFG